MACASPRVSLPWRAIYPVAQLEVLAEIIFLNNSFNRVELVVDDADMLAPVLGVFEYRHGVLESLDGREQKRERHLAPVTVAINAHIWSFGLAQ